MQKSGKNAEKHSFKEISIFFHGELKKETRMSNDTYAPLSSP
jgi:hypothetical protein